MAKRVVCTCDRCEAEQSDDRSVKLMIGNRSGFDLCQECMDQVWKAIDPEGKLTAKIRKFDPEFTTPRVA